MKWQLLFLLSCFAIALVGAHELADDEDDEAPAVPQGGAAAAPAATEGAPSAPKPAGFQFPDKPEGPYGWAMEIGAIGILVLYAVNYFMGGASNKKLATAWMKEVCETMEQNFARVGLKEAMMVQESNDEYKFYATGRINCSGVLATLNLQTRQDLLSRFILSQAFPKYDTCTLEIPLDSLDPMVFALCRKRDTKNTHNTLNDVRAYCKQRTIAGLPANLSVLSDTMEAAELLLPSHVVKALVQYEPYVQMIHVSDQVGIGNTQPAAENADGKTEVAPVQCRKVLKFVMRLPSTESKMAECVPLVRVAMQMIDLCANVRVSDKTRTAVQDMRRAFEQEMNRETEEERQEKMREKKAEKKRQQEEEFEKLTPEQQRKREEKDAKKALKQRTGKMKMMRI
eukprot:GDKI01003659.1.p1 GENE.GDKI01003659.1~~GDKI01003659.1.p1  ORF type:complete len:398 (+),score=142.90 GDKI01003659.1:130-1323(+)